MSVKHTKKVYEAIGQEVIEGTLDSGLRVALLKKPGFQRKFMTFSTHYGSIDSAFVRPGSAEVTRVPDGIAHFLEHKLFEEPDGMNVLEKYSRMGASPNAYTGYEYTVYLCSLVEGFDEGFDLLLDYVQRPHFTDENVSKEQGIIGQEIQTIRDSPPSMVHYNLMEALYQRHPARIGIAGTVESIAQITKELLYLCHDTFYHPSNMIVAVAGDVEFDRIADLVEADMGERNYEQRGPIQRIFDEEPTAVREAELRHKMKVSRPRVLMGFKGNFDRREGEDASAYHRRQIVAELALEAVLGKSTDLYWSLYERSVIASGYGYHLSTFPGAAHIAVGCESEDPDAFREAITEALAEAGQRGVDPERFEEARKREIGSVANAVDDPQWLVHLYTTFQFYGLDFLERRALLDAVDVAEATGFLKDFVRGEGRACSIIEPI